MEHSQNLYEHFEAYSFDIGSVHLFLNELFYTRVQRHRSEKVNIVQFVNVD